VGPDQRCGVHRVTIKFPPQEATYFLLFHIVWIVRLVYHENSLPLAECWKVGLNMAETQAGGDKVVEDLWWEWTSEREVATL
jgi:hypothetical protein